MPLPPAPLFSRHQLLVSVQDASEAEMALASGVLWIDLKNPSLGSLGQPSLSTAREFNQALLQPIAYQVRRSVALGELDNLNLLSAFELMSQFPIAKVGFAGLGGLGGMRRDAHSSWKTLLSQCPSSCQLVPAIYADNKLANAPDADAILDMVEPYRLRFVLIDTFVKDGRNLFDWLTVEDINSLIARVESRNARLVVAGSLRVSDWPRLAELAPTILGVRGSVCTVGNDRSSRLSPEKLGQWLGRIARSACSGAERKE